MIDLFVFHGNCSMDGPSKSLLGFSSAIAEIARIHILTFKYSNEFVESLHPSHRVLKFKRPFISLGRYRLFPFLKKINSTIFNERIDFLIVWTHNIWNQKFIHSMFNFESIKKFVMIHNNLLYDEDIVTAILNNMFDAIIFCGEDVYKIAVSKFPSKLENFFLVTNTLDFSLITKSLDQCGENLMDIDLIAISGLRSQKNLGTLIKAVKNLEKKLRFKTMIVGPPGDESEYIYELINETNTNSIEMMGALKDPICLLKNAKIYINTSLYEGLSIAVLEAVTLRKPMILSYCSGNKEIIESCPYAFGFKTGDFMELSQLILKLLTNLPLISDDDYTIAMNYISHTKVKHQFQLLVDSRFVI